MVDYANKEHITKFSAASTTDGIKDGTSPIHTGIVKVLEQAARGNHIIEYGNLQQTSGSTYTQFGFDGAVSFLRDGLKVSVSPSAIELSAAPDASLDRYDMLVITVAGPNILAFRNGVAHASPQVLTTPLTAGDIPVALVKVEGGTGDNVTNREIQQYGYNKDTNAVSIAWNGGGTTYTETSSIVGSSNTTTWTAASGSDIKIKLAGTASGDTFEVIDSASQIQFKVQGDGVVTTEGDITAGGDITVGGDLTISDGGIGIGKTGTAKSNVTPLAITNLVSAADMDGTETSIGFNQFAYHGVTPVIENSGYLTFGTENDWLSATPSTRDSYFAISTAVDGTLTERLKLASTGNLQIDGDLTLGGNDITLANGCTIVNTDANTLTITEASTILSGDLTVTGNDLTFGNGATIVNTDANTLTVTEATTAFSAAVTAGTSVTAPTITASTQLITSSRLSRVGIQSALSVALSAGPPVVLGAALSYQSIQFLNTVAAPANYFLLPVATGNSGAVITLKNLSTVDAIINAHDGTVVPYPPEDIEGGSGASSIVTAAAGPAKAYITLPSMAHVTLVAYDDGNINNGTLSASAGNPAFTVGWVIVGQGL